MSDTQVIHGSSAKPRSNNAVKVAIALVLALVAAFAGRVLWHRLAVQKAVPQELAALRASRQDLSEIIESYRRQRGYYPPSSQLPGGQDGVLNPLFYELEGTRHKASEHTYNLPTTKDPVTQANLKEWFGLEGLSNSLPMPEWPTNFTSGHALGFRTVRDDTEVLGLEPNDAVRTEDLVDDLVVSTWRYRTGPGIHNTGKFDIWVEMDALGKHYTIGNWPGVE
ncbi:MAG TPA: hypothetical protein VMF06_09840 [Candidatus Limnocylindria bacterium]|jgi:hypothetical protein|nr:hypothetical protein [Candidatus Limnocylindria bacterium]